MGYGDSRMAKRGKDNSSIHNPTYNEKDVLYTELSSLLDSPFGYPYTFTVFFLVSLAYVTHLKQQVHAWAEILHLSLSVSLTSASSVDWSSGWKNYWPSFCSSTEAMHDGFQSQLSQCTLTLFLIQWSWVMLIFVAKCFVPTPQVKKMVMQ